MGIRGDQPVKVTAEFAIDPIPFAAQFGAGLPPAELAHHDIVRQAWQYARDKTCVSGARADANPVAFSDLLFTG